MNALIRCQGERPRDLIVTSVQALMQRVLSPTELARRLIRLSLADEEDPEELAELLSGSGYRFEHEVVLKGQAALRGGLLDVFTPGDEPLRIEFFDDEESARQKMELKEQRRLKKLKTEKKAAKANVKYDDPVRMYLREMGTVPLLTRQGEVSIARRIERGEKRVLNALAYLAEPEDLIPDHIPGIGFLDDAIMIELVVRELRPEIDADEDVCRYRRELKEESGSRVVVSRQEWLDARRDALQSRMRRLRSKLDPEGELKPIETLRGRGYRFALQRGGD